MNNDKVKAYVGFAVKKGSVVFGLDSLECYRKKVHVILFSPDISDNSLKKLKEEALRLNCRVIEFYDLSETLKKNCKALGVCDKQLALAIIDNLL